ncbi:MAG: division/cell wall cluster transcriptional repressor MraZ [Patescibacteria group bacterium]
MLIGEYTHTIDTKKRVSLPVKFRAVMGKKMIMSRWLDNCISIYTVDEWKKVSEELSNLTKTRANHRDYERFITTGAVDVAVDSIGRILIPDFLKDYAKLKIKVVLAGVNNHIEIWDEKIWKAYKEKIEKQADILAERLDEVNVI